MKTVKWVLCKIGQGLWWLSKTVVQEMVGGVAVKVVINTAMSGKDLSGDMCFA